MTCYTLPPTQHYSFLRNLSPSPRKDRPRVLGAFRKRVLRSAASFTVTATQHNNKVRVENTKEMLANQKRTKTVQEGEAGLTGIENEEMNNSS